MEEQSAVLGFPNEVTIAMHGNHQTMCRFRSIEEMRYRPVWTNIQNMAGSAAKNSPSTCHQVRVIADMRFRAYIY